MSNNYVVSALTAIDATIELNDTTTEGATLERSSLTFDWLVEHNFAFGKEISSPWVLDEDNELLLWFEVIDEDVAIENVDEDVENVVWFEGEELVAEGDMMLFNVKGQLMMHGVNRMNVVGLPAGVYMVRTANGVAKVILGR